jgi:hypothetical protein
MRYVQVVYDWHVSSANGAPIKSAWSNAPREKMADSNPSALKARLLIALSRAFSARSPCNLRSWGVAPGYDESALSALSRYVTADLL